MTAPSHDRVRIGLVATSDRAAQGVYRDEGIPALEQWLAAALLNPIEFERRLIPDERAAEPFLERGDAFVPVDAGRGAVADRHQPDEKLACHHSFSSRSGASASRTARNSSR